MSVPSIAGNSDQCYAAAVSKESPAGQNVVNFVMREIESTLVQVLVKSKAYLKAADRAAMLNLPIYIWAC